MELSTGARGGGALGRGVCPEGSGLCMLLSRSSKISWTLCRRREQISLGKNRRGREGGGGMLEKNSSVHNMLEFSGWRRAPLNVHFEKILNKSQVSNTILKLLWSFLRAIQLTEWDSPRLAHLRKLARCVRGTVKRRWKILFNVNKFHEFPLWRCRRGQVNKIRHPSQRRFLGEPVFFLLPSATSGALGLDCSGWGRGFGI